MRISMAVICLAALLCSTMATADVPPTFSYQGVLTDDRGDPVPDGDYEVLFRLFGMPTGGSELWEEPQVVTCEGGLFSTILGVGEPLGLSFDRTYWLEVELRGQAPMQPRVQLTAVPYAIHALNTGTAADEDWVISGDDIHHVPGQVAIGVTAPQPSGAKLHISASEKGIYSRILENDAAADGRCAIYGLRSRNVDNDGAGYGFGETNNAITGNNSYGDSYTFGVAGYTTHDSPYTGGVIGAPADAGLNWGALGYRDSNTQPWGVYTPGAAYVGATLSTEAFHMLPGAVDGYVLTCTDAGFAYWEPPAAGFSLPYSGSTGTTGTAFEVTNTNSGNLATAVKGHTDGAYGGYFTSSLPSPNAMALFAEATGTGDYHTKGILATATPADNYGYGGIFYGGYRGVYGKVNVTGADANAHYYGVSGIVEGIYGTNYGVLGNVSQGDGINYGVYGSVNADGENIGVYGKATNGVTNYAGYFEGDVEITGTLSKSAGSFKIDHPLDPENKYLSHSFVESPDMMNIYNGNVVLDSAGEGWVTLPDWFEALNRDFRYQLTPMGAPGPNLYVAEKINGNQFKIAGGSAGLEVSWQVTGVRQDPYAEAHRIPVEEYKKTSERGKYLNPDLYGQPESLGLLWTAPDQNDDQE
jgi:hypothetical protein